MAQQSSKPPDGVGNVESAAQDSLWSEVMGMASVFRTSRQRNRLLMMAAALIAVVGATAYVQVKLNAWNRPFYNALTRKDLPAFVEQIGIFAVLAGILLVLNVAQTWLNQRSKIVLREGLVNDLLNQWLSPRRAFRLSNSGTMGANPDQRLQADAQHLTDLTTELGIGLLQSTLLLLLFIGVLWDSRAACFCRSRATSSRPQALTGRIEIGVVARASMNWGSVAASPSARNAAVRKVQMRALSKTRPTIAPLALRTRSGPPIVLVEPLCIFIVKCNERVPGRAPLHEFARHVELDMAVEPIDRFHGERRNQHALAKPQIASVNDEVVDAPVRIVEHEILNMADFPVDGLNTVSSQFDDTAQMRIGSPRPTVSGSFGLVGWTQAQIGRRHQRRSHSAWDRREIDAAPQWVPTVITVKLILHLLRYWLIFKQFGAVFDLGSRQRNNELLPLEVLPRNGRWMD